MSWLQSKDVRGNGAGGPAAQRAVGERSGGAAGGAAPAAVPDPELVERAQRRRFTAAYKLAVLREADGLSGSGEIGALLRREGLYSSHLSTWRAQREAGVLEALARPRGRRPRQRSWLRPPTSGDCRSSGGTATTLQSAKPPGRSSQPS